MARQNENFRVGDMVTLKEYCLDAGRLAIIVEVPPNIYSQACKIQWIDEPGLASGPRAALIRNLAKVENE